MALVQFENSPSTNTPINATNLNNNFNELANRGVIYYASGEVGSVSTNTIANLYNITLPVGLYVGYVMVRNQSGGTTPFKTLINFDDGNIDHAGMEVLSTGWTNYKCPIVMNLGATTTLYARAKHDSSETHTMDGELLVIKLK